MGDEPIQQDESQSARAKPKGLLYHYTTADGLLGIVRNKNIRATHIRYLNDWTEFKNAFRSKYVDRLIGSLVPGAKQALKDSLSGLVPIAMSTLESFIICFSDDETVLGRSLPAESGLKPGDRLSQWRSYSSGSKGFSLGFNLDRLTGGWNGYHPKAWDVPARLCQCIYTDAEKLSQMGALGANGQKETFSLYKSRLAEFQREKLREPDEDESAEIVSECIVKPISTTVIAHNLCAGYFKDESFHEECEWRLVFQVERRKLLELQHTKPDEPFVHFRSGVYGITPYIEYPLDLSTEKNPLQRIVVGPSPHADEEAYAVELLWGQMGLEAWKFQSPISLIGTGEQSFAVN